MSNAVWVSIRDNKGRTFTIGGNSFDEFFNNATDVLGPQQAQQVTEDFQFIVNPDVQQAVGNAQPLRGGSTGQAQPAAPGAPTCPHGPRQFKPAFQSKAGKDMPSSWQCPSRDRNDQCKAQWNDA